MGIQRFPEIEINSSSVSSGGLQGTWNASTNTPALANTDTEKSGQMYQVSVGGTVNFGAGNITFEAKDIVINNGTTWDKIDATDAIVTVNGNSGVVVLDKADIGLPNVDNTADSNKPVSTATQSALDLKFNISDVIDEDDFSSNSATKVPTQQSVKEYIANNVGGGGFWDLSAMQNNEQTVTNSTTFVDSEDLQIDLEAGKTYILSYFLGLDDNDNAGGAFGSAKHCLVYTGTAANSRQSKFNYGSGRMYYSQQEFGGSNDSFVVPKGTVWQGSGMIETTTAGTLKVQFAQGFATASTTAYLRAWSYLLAKEVV